MLLLTTVTALNIDEETGCELYSDHVVCPQDTSITVFAKYSEDSTCYSLQNEFGNLENLACFAHAELTQPIEYESCKMYIPFDENDLLLDQIEYDYQCSTEKLDTNQEIEVLGKLSQYQNCDTIEEDEFYGEYVCPTTNTMYTITGNMIYVDGNYSLLAFEQSTPDSTTRLVNQFATPLMGLGILVLFVYAWYIWSERKK